MKLMHLFSHKSKGSICNRLETEVELNQLQFFVQFCCADLR